MTVFTSLVSAIADKPVKVWVLAPYLHTDDDNIDYYYDFSQSIAEYKKSFAELGIDWKWQPVTINNYPEVIQNIVQEKINGATFPIVFNICDGDEVNGTPGISVVKLLEEKGLIYTGSNEFFYDITTSKIPMKKAFDRYKVPTAKWEVIYNRQQDIRGIFERLGTPIIVKPSVSGGSMGVGVKNVVYTETELLQLIDTMFNGYRGWNLAVDGLIAEAFISGNEYTTLIVGACNKPKSAAIYNPVQRIFHPSLPEHERFLSFDRLWEIYEEESPMPDAGNFYEYAPPDDNIIEDIKKLSWAAYVATKGKGYTRVDIRQDAQTGKLYVLEVNAQCGISEDEDFTSIGAILRLNRKTFTELLVEIINGALQTHALKLPDHKKTRRPKVKYIMPTLGKLGDTA
jgi:D-alanine-D-alanine ligase